MDLIFWIAIWALPAAVALVAVGWLLGQEELGECLNAGLFYGLLAVAAFWLGGVLKVGPWLGYLWLAAGVVLMAATSWDRYTKWRKDRFIRRIQKHAPL